MKMALTGHRPQRLGLLDLSADIPVEWRRLIDWLKVKIQEENISVHIAEWQTDVI